MFAKVKQHVFIDKLTLELFSSHKNGFKAILKDECGFECRRMEAEGNHQLFLTWGGLNDLPYGVYILELQQGDNEMQMKIIKRV